MSRSRGHGQVERRVGQDERLPGRSSGIEPAVHHLDDAIAQDLRLKNAAVEEDGRWTSGVVLAVSVQESGQVARYRRIADIGQAHLMQARTSATLRFVI